MIILYYAKGATDRFDYLPIRANRFDPTRIHSSTAIITTARVQYHSPHSIRPPSTEVILSSGMTHSLLCIRKETFVSTN